MMRLRLCAAIALAMFRRCASRRLSRASCQGNRYVSRRGRNGHRRAHDFPESRRAHRRLVRDRQPRRRRRHDRHRAGGQSAGRRLHDRRRRAAAITINPALYRKTCVRRRARFCADIHAGQRAGGARRASFAARAQRQGTHRRREKPSRRALVCVPRQRHAAASCGRALQIDGRRQHRSRTVQRQCAGDDGPHSGPGVAVVSDRPLGHAARAGEATARAGRTTAKRAAGLPDIPTIAESGLPGYDASAWYGVLAPAGTPPAIIAKLQSEIHIALRSPDIVDKLSAQGLEPAPNNADEFARFIAAELAKWNKIIAAAGIKVE